VPDEHRGLTSLSWIVRPEVVAWKVPGIERPSDTRGAASPPSPQQISLAREKSLEEDVLERRSRRGCEAQLNQHVGG
jgi:hypothetical protein